MGPVELLAREHSQRVSRLKRIRRVSWFMKWFVTLFMVLLILIGSLFVAILVAPHAFDALDEVIEFGAAERRMGDVSLAQRLGMSVLVGAAFLGLSAVCWQIRQLFEILRQGDYFSPGTLARFGIIGLWLLVFGLFDILLDPLGSLLLTYDLPAGMRQFSLSLDGAELFFFVIGGLMIVCGWTLREAALIAEENRQFV